MSDALREKVDGRLIRTFVAIDLDSDLRARVHSRAIALLKTVATVRVPAVQNLHLTLKFIGDTPTKSSDQENGPWTSTQWVAQMSKALRRVAERGCPIDLQIAGVGVFPGKGHARIVWFGVNDPEGELARLAQSINREFAQLGFPQEKRPFHPHITVGRVTRGSSASGSSASGSSASGSSASESSASTLRSIASAKRVGDPLSWAVSALVLKKSDLSAAGAVYEDLEIAPLSRMESSGVEEKKIPVKRDR